MYLDQTEIILEMGNYGTYDRREGEFFGGDSWRNQSYNLGQKERTVGFLVGIFELQDIKYVLVGFLGQKVLINGFIQDRIVLVFTCEEILELVQSYRQFLGEFRVYLESSKWEDRVREVRG